MKTTKILTKVTAALTVGAVLASFALHAVKPNYSDVSEDHWAYEQICSVTEAGLMVGMGENEGEYFGKDDMVTASEMYTTLYRLAESPEITPTFTNSLEIGYPYSYDPSNLNGWYVNPWKWAVYNGVSEVDGYLSAVPTPNLFVSGLRYGGEFNGVEESSGDFSGEYYIDNNDLFKNVSRADVVLTLYFYVTEYLGVNVTETADLSEFWDWDENELIEASTNLTNGDFGNILLTYPEELKAACEWAVGSGIIVGYPNGTIGIQDVKLYWDPLGFGENVDYVWHEIRDLKYVTRAEYAVILDRFMDYCENLK